jgi:ligand-binding sensor domain-containing protein
MRLVVLVMLALLGVACSDTDSEQRTQTGKAPVQQAPDASTGQPATTTAKPAASLPRIQEYFGIGKNVFARSLAYEPANNAVWVGTSLGVHEIDATTRDVRNTYTRSDGLANEYIFAMLVDSADGKWFGTNGGGATYLRDGHWRTFFPMHGLADYWVYAFAEQSDGHIWIGTWNGANRYDPSDDSLKTYVDELVNEWVYSIAVDRHDHVWFGTEGGVSMFDGSQWRSWTHKDGLGAPNSAGLPLSTNTGLGTRSRHDLNVMVDGRPSYNPNYVFCLYIDDAGTVWAGTWGGGVSRFDGKQWTNLTHSDGLAGDIVYSITQDKYGAMWFGTQQGVSRYQDGDWQTLGTKQGAGGASIYSLVALPDGDVWAGTRGGVIRIGYGVPSAER